jgi:hypothetical protein
MPLKIGEPAGAKRESVLNMLRQICPEADLQVDEDGTVFTKEADFCTRSRETPLLFSCQCLCDLIRSDKTVIIVVEDDLRATGGGRTDDAVPDDTVNGKGSDEIVTSGAS